MILHFGRARIQVDGRSWDLAEESVALLLPGHEEHFAFSRDGETLHSYVHIDPKLLADETLARLASLPYVLPLSRDMENLIHQATTFRRGILSTRDKILDAMALQMLWQYVGEAEAIEHAGTDDEALYHRVPRVQLFIHDHLADGIDLTKLASVAHLSKAQLTRLFRQRLGTTPMAYVWKQRTAAGIEMLKNSGLAIEEIAGRCGFESRYHFSRRIKEATDLAPGRLRRSHWNAEALPAGPRNRASHDTEAT